MVAPAGARARVVAGLIGGRTEGSRGPHGADTRKRSFAVAANLIAVNRQELRLDLGTATGVFLREYPGGPSRSFTLHLATEEELKQQRREGRERTLHVRFVRLLTFILDQVYGKPTDIVFEDPPCKSSGYLPLGSKKRAN